MDIITMEHVKQLSQRDEGPHLSLFLPTTRISTEEGPDLIQFKNLVNQAKDELETLGLRTPDIQAFLEPVESLIKDNTFWRHQSDGLALFLSRHQFKYYRLPLALDPLWVVGERFLVRPLLPLLAGDGRFFILALSQNEIRLFQGSKLSVQEIQDLGGIPESLAEALAYDDPEKQLQSRISQPSATGRGAAMFHGHGDGEDPKKGLLRYFQMVDRGMREFLDDEPLVLAGVDYLLPIYSQASSYDQLMDEGVIGNPEHLKPEELHERAWEIVQPHFFKERDQVFSRFFQMAGTGLTSTDLREILPAATHGRVEHLFAALGVHQWGSYDRDSDTFSLDGQGGEDLIDLAVVQALRNGGKVHVAPVEDLPESMPLSAIFRY